jgi:hypothetical protein
MNAWLWGILSVVGTTALAGVTKRLIDWSFERSASLVVQITINEAVRSPLMFKDVNELRDRVRSPGERTDLSWESRTRFHDYFHAEHYVHFGVRNNSKSKLSNLTFCAHQVNGAMLQVGEGEMIQVKADQPIPLGDLQPRREIILHLLAGSLWNANTPKDIRKSLVFSADELGRVAYKFPMPFYQRMRWMGIFQFMWYVFSICLIGTLIVLAVPR